MYWTLFIAMSIALGGGLVVLYRRDRRREHQRVRDVLSPDVQADLKAEREAALGRKAQFANALQSAAHKQKRDETKA